jgi:hypothetical protein
MFISCLVAIVQALPGLVSDGGVLVVPRYYYYFLYSLYIHIFNSFQYFLKKTYKKHLKIHIKIAVRRCREQGPSYRWLELQRQEPPHNASRIEEYYYYYYFEMSVHLLKR